MKDFKIILFSILLTISAQMFAQQTLSGKVIEKTTGEGLPGVSILRKGTVKGTSSDFDGKFELKNVKTGDVFVFSSIGFATKEITIGNNFNLTVALVEDDQLLDEVVVVGYGTAKKEDVTGAAELISSKDFNKGPVVSAQQLITGKVAGVNVVQGSAPGDGQNINIRGIGSISLDSQPLYVIDGMPINNGGVGGTRNPLNLINPNDIASISVLKDASATAIYGSRGANGVIIITTKKGYSSDFKFNVTSSTSVYSPIGKVDVLSADQFRTEVINSGNQTAISLLGTANTDWQDLIYKEAFGSDHSFSALGSIGKVPSRFSLGYSDHDGILKNDNFKRITASVNITPSFFDDHLKVELSAKGNYTENTFADRGAIGSAVYFDPTQNVFGQNSPFANYFTWLQNSDPTKKVSLSPTNPLASLDLISDTAEIRRVLANAKFDYKLHFFKDITATINVGIDKSDSAGRKMTSELFPTDDASFDGALTRFTANSTNKLFDAYLTYNKTFNDKHNFTAVLGHSYQSFEFDDYNFDSEKQEDGLTYEFIDRSKNVLLSYFGRFNYDFNGKYLVTATLRADASSKLNPENRWGYFPSLALAWNIHKENFMTNSFFNELKLRAGYGEVGNVNGLGDYLFLTRYTASQDTANYQFGSNNGVPSFLQTYRPSPESKNLRWEIGRTLNIGLDYAFLNRRISGSLNAYVRQTKDLISSVSIDPFTNFGNRVDKNIGDMENRGIELAINTIPVKNDDFTWNVNYNISINDNKITDLPDQQFVGGISGGVGNNVQTHIQGQTPFTYLVYQQVYDTNGKPIEGAYVDRNNDGEINDNDKYLYKDPFADVLMGLNTNLQYKNWDLSVVTRASIGNYNYNNVASNGSDFRRLIPTTNDYLSNLHSDFLNTRFTNITDRSLRSDYYVTDASFFKIDNITLGYKLENFLKNGNLRLYGSLQNVATFTKYKGIDPEISGGIDNDFYPRPRTFVLGLNLDF